MSRLDEEYKIRNIKREQAFKNSLNPYPARIKKTHSIIKVLADFKELMEQKSKLSIVGRVKSVRVHGGSSFAHVEDGTETIQVFIRKDELGQENYKNFKDLIDIGDFITATGICFYTKKGEKTLLVKDFNLVVKSLMPLPEKWHGLSDVEIRYRKRYLDLIANPAIREIFKKRSIIIKSIRQFLDDNEFIEVETPILQPIPGGANARPFKTHHNALDNDLYLRIAPELYLKRLIIGGYEKVYEIARCFRNEGIDKTHNPEFTQVEFYAAYWDYKKMMNFTEKLIEQVVLSVNNELIINYENNKINFTPPFEKISFTDACKKFAKVDIIKANNQQLNLTLKSHKITVNKPITKAKLLDEIFKELIIPKLIQPTFVYDYPIELSPLAKKKEDDQCFTERFQLVAANKELCNAFSELNDPIDQQERFLNQEKMRQSGDEEAQRIDEDFIEALNHGMPPTAGIGIGIDRLTNLLTNTHNIKEVILFPALKQKK